MTMHAGTVAHFGGSMAEAIDQAFGAELFALKGTPLPDASTEERHMLFAAIAQGVLGYLHANQSDLTIVIGSETYQLQVNFVKAGT